MMVLTALLYVATLSTVSFSAGSGDAVMGDAIASFLFTVALWIVLALLFAVAAVMGAISRPFVVIGALLLPLAAVTSFVAMDMCSRHIKWAVIGPVLLPLLMASLAAVARFEKLRTAFPGNGFITTVCSSVAILSLVLLVAAAI
jgi:hypothetical protein